MKVYRGSREMALLILNLVARLLGAVNITPLAVLTWETTPVPAEQGLSPVTRKKCTFPADFGPKRKKVREVVSIFLDNVDDFGNL